MMHVTPRPRRQTPHRAAQRRSVAAATLVALLLGALDALALDYDRNDVMVREVATMVMAVPSDTAPIGVMARGVARRQTRNFGVGVEVMAGITTDPRPYLSVAGLAGFESSSNGWDQLRVYGEGGVGVAWVSNNPMDWLQFHVEGGTRILLSTLDRPHLALTSGLRITTSFRHVGWGLQVGLSWSFD